MQSPHEKHLNAGGGGGGTPILDHSRDVQPEGMSFPGPKHADGCKFFYQKPADGS